jgi:hypothetical protein
MGETGTEAPFCLGQRLFVEIQARGRAGDVSYFVTGVDLGQLRSDGGLVGMQFTVGASPITVTALGRMCAPGNSRVHALRLLDATL